MDFVLLLIVLAIIALIIAAIVLKGYDIKTAIDERQVALTQKKLFAETDAKVNLMKSARPIEIKGHSYLIVGVDEHNEVIFKPLADAPEVTAVEYDARIARLRGLAAQFVLWTVKKTGPDSTALIVSDELRAKGWGTDTLQEARRYLIDHYDVMAKPGLGTVLRSPYGTAGELLAALVSEVVPPAQSDVEQSVKSG